MKGYCFWTSPNLSEGKGAAVSESGGRIGGLRMQKGARAREPPPRVAPQAHGRTRAAAKAEAGGRRVAPPGTRAPSLDCRYGPSTALVHKVQEHGVILRHVRVRVEDDLTVPPHALRPFLVVLALAVVCKDLLVVVGIETARKSHSHASYYRFPCLIAMRSKQNLSAVFPPRTERLQLFCPHFSILAANNVERQPDVQLLELFGRAQVYDDGRPLDLWHWAEPLAKQDRRGD